MLPWPLVNKNSGEDTTRKILREFVTELLPERSILRIRTVFVPAANGTRTFQAVVPLANWNPPGPASYSTRASPTLSLAVPVNKAVELVSRALAAGKLN